MERPKPTRLVTRGDSKWMLKIWLAVQDGNATALENEVRKQAERWNMTVRDILLQVFEKKTDNTILHLAHLGQDPRAIIQYVFDTEHWNGHEMDLVAFRYAKNNKGRTPFMQVCATGPNPAYNYGVASALDAMQEYGIDHDDKCEHPFSDRDSLSAVHLAFQAQNMNTIKWLHENGRDFTLPAFTLRRSVEGRRAWPVSVASIAVENLFADGVKFLHEGDVKGGKELFHTQALMKHTSDRWKMTTPARYASEMLRPECAINQTLKRWRNDHRA
ncbi:hypothetical protein B0T16DRAFT_491175 [Cercophora newfieldiana]|uniref:Uncharacterized protein n=1 Tax=Cercophora newfieldiana TaxID=92897 RepID=A0AA40CRB4_9PEZI|nr:hypothetical protein B0T16DRAFT_491175 [Cercophora newfieldiana]